MQTLPPIENMWYQHGQWIVLKLLWTVEAVLG